MNCCSCCDAPAPNVTPATDVLYKRLPPARPPPVAITTMTR
jgi:hypothetical protein